VAKGTKSRSLKLRFVHDLTVGDSQANALAQGLSGLVTGMHLTGIAEGVGKRPFDGRQLGAFAAHGRQTSLRRQTRPLGCI